MLGNLVRFSSYAYAFREMASLVTRSRSTRMKELERSKNIRMLLGLSVGAAIGVSTGLLMAPRSGRETRSRLAGQTNEIMGHLRESAYHASERARLRGQRAAVTTKEAAEEARTAMSDIR